MVSDLITIYFTSTVSGISFALIIYVIPRFLFKVQSQAIDLN